MSARDLSRRYVEHPLHDLLRVAVAEPLGARLVTADARVLGRLDALLALRAVGLGDERIPGQPTKIEARVLPS